MNQFRLRDSLRQQPPIAKGNSLGILATYPRHYPLVALEGVVDPPQDSERGGFCTTGETFLREFGP